MSGAAIASAIQSDDVVATLRSVEHSGTSLLTYLSGGGEMGALIRAHDWRSTALGPPEFWPQPLRTAIRLLLTSQHPMFIWWGPELIQFYNDAYSLTMGPERTQVHWGSTAVIAGRKSGISSARKLNS